jgi:hypothetical protein
MKIKYHSFFVALTLLSISFAAQSQEDLLKLVDTAKKGSEVIPSTWKDTRLINAATTKTVDPGVMEFFISHRFGNVGGEGNGGFHTFYGFDIASDIDFAFQFGLAKNLMIGISRSKQQELLDVDVKYKFITQTTTMPVSLAFYGDAGITPEINATFYNGAEPSTPVFWEDRLSYFGEFILDRRFGRYFSFELLGGVQHRNYVLQSVNPSNYSTDENNIVFSAAGGKLKLTKHANLVFDYYYIYPQYSPYRVNNPTNPYHNPFSIGYEVETGGHVFEVNFSNAAGLNENNIIPYTSDSWAKGGFKLGFSISRVFNI